MMRLLRALLAAVSMKREKTQEPVGNSTTDMSGRFTPEPYGTDTWDYKIGL